MTIQNKWIFSSAAEASARSGSSHIKRRLAVELRRGRRPSTHVDIGMDNFRRACLRARRKAMDGMHIQNTQGLLFDYVLVSCRFAIFSECFSASRFRRDMSTWAWTISAARACTRGGRKAMAEILEIREPKNLHAWVESFGGSRHYGRILQL